MNDWPMPKPPPYPADDEVRETPERRLERACAFNAPHTRPPYGEVAPVPPPDVWEFYRRHGRWPDAGEA